MRFSWFIARRIIGQRAHRSSVSGPIITIGIIAIALGVITMLIALGTGVGLQNKIGEKVASFSGHIRVTSLENSQGLETKKPIKDVSLLTKNIFALPNTKAVQSVAYVPGVVLNNQAFDGIIFKGIDDSFQMDFFSFFGGTTWVILIEKMHVAIFPGHNILPCSSSCAKLLHIAYTSCPYNRLSTH